VHRPKNAGRWFELGRSEMMELRPRRRRAGSAKSSGYPVSSPDTARGAAAGDLLIQLDVPLRDRPPTKSLDEGACRLTHLGGAGAIGEKGTYRAGQVLG
jgi:hypothetical protein